MKTRLVIIVCAAIFSGSDFYGDYIIIVTIFTKNQKVWLCGRGDLTSLFFSKVVKF